MAGPAALVVPALKRHTSSVIVMHGLGDSGAGWSFLAETWRRQGKFQETSFIFPNAPSIPISVNMGMRMPGWYDIVRPKGAALDFEDLQQKEDEAGILRTQAYVHSLIAAEVEKGIPSDRIILGGFSQGGSISLLAGVTCPTRLGGIFGLSSYLLLRGKLRDLIPSENPNKQTPIFIGHGDADQVVRYEWGQKTAQQLKEWGWNVDFRTYKGLPHSAHPDEIDHLEAYIKERVPNLGDEAGKASRA